MTSRQLADLMIRRRDLFEPALRSATREIARIAIARSKELMTEQIYSKAEDRRKNGKKVWRRTGHLRRSEQVQIVSAYRCDVVNTAVYAEPRHEAGKPGRRAINPARESHWRDDLVEGLRTAVLDLRREAILKVLRADRGVG